MKRVSLILRGVHEDPMVELERQAFQLALRTLHTETERHTRSLELEILTVLCQACEIPFKALEDNQTRGKRRRTCIQMIQNKSLYARF
jgi:hypothetical protein